MNPRRTARTGNVVKIATIAELRLAPEPNGSGPTCKHLRRPLCARRTGSVQETRRQSIPTGDLTTARAMNPHCNARTGNIVKIVTIAELQRSREPSGSGSTLCKGLSRPPCAHQTGSVQETRRHNIPPIELTIAKATNPCRKTQTCNGATSTKSAGLERSCEPSGSGSAFREDLSRPLCAHRTRSVQETRCHCIPRIHLTTIAQATNPRRKACTCAHVDLRATCEHPSLDSVATRPVAFSTARTFREAP
jgi:hypothetical protein